MPGLSGYTVGLDDETFETVTKELVETGTTDEKGRATITVPIPPTTVGRPIQAKIDIAVAEAGGRQVERVVTLPILPTGPVMASGRASRPAPSPPGRRPSSTSSRRCRTVRGARSMGLKWELLAEERRWQWFMSEGRWSRCWCYRNDF